MVQPTADASPDAEDVTRTEGHTWFGHPHQLARLFTVEMWERFGFYGMRALLTLYLADHFLFSDATTNGLYGAFTALVYLTPVFGGLIADRILGSKRSVKFGAILMACGYFGLCFGGQQAKPFLTVGDSRYEVQIEKKGETSERYVVDGANRYKIKGNDDGSLTLEGNPGSAALPATLAKGSFSSDAERSPFHVPLMLLCLSAITVGNGFFKPNISTIVGTLYKPTDPRRDAGFTIFYMGINLGSLGSQFLCPLLAVAVGWWAGFLLAAIGMLFAFCLMQFDGGRLSGYGEVPEDAPKNGAILTYVISILCIPVAWFLFENMLVNAEAAAAAAKAGTGIVGYLSSLPLLGKTMLATWLIAIIGMPIWAAFKGSREEFHMMFVACLLCAFSVVFWTLFEQAGSSMTFFADRNTDRDILGIYTMPAGQVQVFNALFIVMLAPLASMFWPWLAKRGWEPPVPHKFALGLIIVGLGFLALVFGSENFAGVDFKVPLFWIAFAYFLHSVGELCISPVGLSMITKLSIARVVGMMMGVWFLSTAMAQYVAGVVAQFASVETVGGQVTNLKVSLDTYVGVFQTIGIASIVIGVFLMAIAPLLKRWMHGVR